VWVLQPPRPRWWLHVALLLLTFLSTLVVGARMHFNFVHNQPVFSLSDGSLSFFLGWILQHPSNLLLGLPFALTLMVILLSHEMGHYLYARHYRVYATLPFFVPFPSLIGTLGAFIRIKSPIPSRAALFDIGIAGPIAGFIPACIALLLGLWLSHPGIAGVTSDIQLGFPLAFHLGARLLHLAAPLNSLSLHPIAAAAWVGMFATALNLLPGGQLDGGHIVYSITPRLHRWVSVLTVLALLPFGKYFWTGWLLWAVLLAVTARHPHVPTYPAISGRRRWVAAFGLLMLILSFTPAPFTHASGREAWPEIRDEMRHMLHRN
jgi:membrane-associated protease RseP (regulator of RpoE activity)